MLTAEGCRQRRVRLWSRLENPGVHALALADPVHLRYFANVDFDPISLAADMPAVLLIDRDGRATLVRDRRMPESVASAHVDETVETNWYPGLFPGEGPRQLALDDGLAKLGVARIVDGFADPLRASLFRTIAEMRRAKDPDEIAAIRTCMKAGEAGHAWARSNLRAGMSELEVYAAVHAACEMEAGRPVIVYGDFAVSPGPERMGGPPTRQVLKAGDMFILDFSVVIGGYRSDFTNTMVVGGEPNAEQQRLCDLCLGAMAAGESALRTGAACRDVYNAVNGAFFAAKMDRHFPHHAGHGLGLTHPESPFFVRAANETLVAGDVVTLEPGLYVSGVGGIRIEHNYLIIDTGYERLSNHAIALG